MRKLRLTDEEKKMVYDLRAKDALNKYCIEEVKYENLTPYELKWILGIREVKRKEKQRLYYLEHAEEINAMVQENYKNNKGVTSRKNGKREHYNIHRVIEPMKMAA
jgi:hypothetical protein